MQHESVRTGQLGQSHKYSNGSNRGALCLFPSREMVLEARTPRTIPCPDGNAVLWGRKACHQMPPCVVGPVSIDGEFSMLRIGWYGWVGINSPEAFRVIFDEQVIKYLVKFQASWYIAALKADVV